jgi:DNA-directed RNA polymerase subunit RPC12/RpoP
VIAFFKENNIDYRFEKSAIIFPCINCYSETEMDQKTTNWVCNCCGGKGTLKHLIDAAESNQINNLKNQSVFHPKKAYKDLEKQFQKIISKNSQLELEITDLKESAFILIRYLLEKHDKGA